MYSTVKSYIIGKNTYMFICQSRSTRSGFAHDCELIKNMSSHLSKAACYYLNRTWERFTYQTVMIEAIRLKLKEYELRARDEFLTKHGISRITAKRKPELEAFIAAQSEEIETWRELKQLYNIVK